MSGSLGNQELLTVGEIKKACILFSSAQIKVAEKNYFNFKNREP
jgi:fructose-specific phosphotransferase system component IIB